MAVKIRLRRMGQKKAPFYRIVVADSRSPRDGRCIEEIGTYDPTKDPSEYHVDAELAKKWLSNGAQPTETVNRIFKAAGIEKQEVIAKSLVDFPDEVVVTETESEKGTILELRVAQSDMGKVIGKQGRIAKAIRSVVKAAASKEDKKVIVEIMQ